MLSPGGDTAIETAPVRVMHDEETRRAYLQAIPKGRYGAPEEAAAEAVYPTLPQSSCITGVTLAVEGGFLSSGVIKQEQGACNPAIGGIPVFPCSVRTAGPLPLRRRVDIAATSGSVLPSRGPARLSKRTFAQ